MGAVDTTYTFTATDTITSAKMNNIIDQTTITTDAIIGTTLDVASGKLKIRSQGITSNEMGNNSILTSAIANSTSTTTGVTTAKIADSNITTIKIADANITAAKLSGAQTGNAPIFGARAFGAFAATGGIVTPYANGNVSNISRTGVGAYVVSLATALPDQFYSVVASAYHASGVSYGNSVSITINNASQFQMQVGQAGGSAYDPVYVSFAVFR